MSQPLPRKGIGTRRDSAHKPILPYLIETNHMYLELMPMFFLLCYDITFYIFIVPTILHGSVSLNMPCDIIIIVFVIFAENLLICKMR